jgi:uncharacterized membrane protein
MIRFMRHINVQAPAEKVFTYLADPKHLPEIWPNVIEVKNVKRASAGGFDFDWSYKMAGLKFDGRAEAVEYLQNQRLVWKTTKGLESTLRWKFMPEGSSTSLTLEFDYSIPPSLLKRGKEEVITRENEHEIEAMLANVRTKVELEIAYA